MGAIFLSAKVSGRSGGWREHSELPHSSGEQLRPGQAGLGTAGERTVPRIVAGG